MPKIKRKKTKYPGVFYIEVKSPSGKPEKIYYIRYRKNGKMYEEKAGRQYQDDMTPARASKIRAMKIDGEILPNTEERKRRRWTINALWEEYVSVTESKGLMTDKGRFLNYIGPVFGDKVPGEINAIEVDRLKRQLLERLKPQTVKHVLGLLKRIVNFGVSRRLCEGLNFKIEMPKVDNLKTEDLTPEQLRNLLDSINQDPDVQARNLMLLALYTGMRRGELFRLKWEHIDFNRGFIRIIGPKGGKDQEIPLNDSARKVLEEHPRSDSEYVFPGKGGKQRVDFKKPINRIKRRAGLPKDFRPLHGLRHVYASMLASSGEVDLYTLQKLLTHKSPLMTQRYAHLRDEALKRASNLAGRLINAAAGEDERSNERG